MVTLTQPPPLPLFHYTLPFLLILSACFTMRHFNHRYDDLIENKYYWTDASFYEIIVFQNIVAAGLAIMSYLGKIKTMMVTTLV